MCLVLMAVRTAKAGGKILPWIWVQVTRTGCSGLWDGQQGWLFSVFSWWRRCEAMVLYWLVIFGVGIYDLCPMAVFGITNLQNLRDKVPLCDLVLGFESCVLPFTGGVWCHCNYSSVCQGYTSVHLRTLIADISQCHQAAFSSPQREV